MKLAVIQVVTMAVLIGQASCVSSKREQGGKVQHRNTELMQIDDALREIAFHPHRMIEEEKEWNARRADLRLSLTWIDLGSRDTVGALVCVVNMGGADARVLPIIPAFYQLEQKAADGTVGPMVAISPIDYPVFKEEDLVRLRSRNAQLGVFAVPSSAFIDESRYRVVASLHYEKLVSGKRQLAQFEISSEWLTGPPRRQ